MAVASINAYRANQLTTISRGQLLLLTYDGLLRFVQEGKTAMLGGQIEVQNANLLKAQELLIELYCTLNAEAFPELANNLQRLYNYMYQRLIHANVHDDVVALDEVTRLTAELREAWAQAEHQVRNLES